MPQPPLRGPPFRGRAAVRPAPTARDHLEPNRGACPMERILMRSDPYEHGACSSPVQVPVACAVATGHKASVQAIKMVLRPKVPESLGEHGNDRLAALAKCGLVGLVLGRGERHGRKANEVLDGATNRHCRRRARTTFPRSPAGQQSSMLPLIGVFSVPSLPLHDREADVEARRRLRVLPGHVQPPACGAKQVLRVPEGLPLQVQPAHDEGANGQVFAGQRRVPQRQAAAPAGGDEHVLFGRPAFSGRHARTQLEAHARPRREAKRVANGVVQPYEVPRAGGRYREPVPAGQHADDEAVAPRVRRSVGRSVWHFGRLAAFSLELGAQLPLPHHTAVCYAFRDPAEEPRMCSLAFSAEDGRERPAQAETGEDAPAERPAASTTSAVAPARPPSLRYLLP
ncbi:hypothetical protein DFJ74DRAFT_291345 [Hyaloraphidium curvatum]|nr:hypothetical protein DFJ74DRAFT_291345 [Hyaloraphidium curvatum]